ncbi:MAG: tyrosine-type recombinase/integrase [Hyphomicrobiales bacterium]|nr:tyrosine-type recombinase/integrase [Hyphomicrobiales bacterium]
MPRLSDARARNVRPGDKAVADGTVQGLYLFASASKGRGKWILRFVSPLTSKRRDMGLGSYPETGIAEVRRAALEARELISRKIDPIEERRLAEESERLVRSMPTFEFAARTVHAQIKDGFRNRKHSNQWITTLETYVFPAIGNRPVNELKARAFADTLRPIWLSKPETASRIRQRCDTIMKWCAAQDFIMASPVATITQLLPRQPGKQLRVVHHPAAPWRDIPGLIRDRFRNGQQSLGKAVLELLILTATRSGEIRGMDWSEIDPDTAIWTIPANRMKAGVVHRVPLTPRCIEIISERVPLHDASSLVFSSRNGTMLSDMTLTKLLRNWKVQSDILGRIATAHGFRSSLSDWATENGYPRELAERALAHTIKNATEAAYHRSDLLDQRRDMMMAWEAHVISGLA